MVSSSQVNRRRNRPAGMPDPMAEVISLSPRSLLDIHPFNCLVCNKGFARDQNMQLHLKSHKLQANLQRRPDNGNRKRVYICPEPTCIYHHPTRALSDITGIKKHFSRRHSRIKNWRCQKCSKKYAVESDLKAHVKKCVSGTRSSYSNGLSRGKWRINDDLQLSSVGASSSRQPMSPILAISTIHENSGEFILPAIADELTFTPIMNGADSDEVVMAYNDSVYSIRQMQSTKLQAPLMSSVPGNIDGIPLELGLSITHSILPHDTHFDYHVHQPAMKTNSGFDMTMVGAEPMGATIQQETIGREGGEVSYDFMLKAMEEAMGLGGLNSGGSFPFSDYDDAIF